MTPSNPVSRASVLASMISQLPEKDRAFAESMCKNIAKNSSATQKQAYWVEVLIKRATDGVQPEVVADVGNFSKVYAIFAQAKKKLKFPKIRLQVNSNPVVLAVAGERSKQPGVINVSDGGPWGSNKWYGRVQPDGTWRPGGDYPELEAVALLLKKLGEEPEKTAAEYGQLTGYCCFCGRSLSDEKSTAVGYGPVCAENFGLKANYKAAKGLLTSLVQKEMA
jgi:hypothetical protein